MKSLLLFALLALVGYLGFWPVAVDPVAWEAPKAPALAADYQSNSALADVKWIARGIGIGPEDVLPDDHGFLYTGYQDGRIVRLDAEGKNPELIADTGGRPFGLERDNQGRLIVADGYRGLLRISAEGDIETLTTEAEGIPFGFTNNVAIASDGALYFTDASSKFGPAMKARDDILEHGGHGRLLAHYPDRDETRVLIDQLQFANGVALAPDEQSLLVTETGAYRITRYWLKGEKAGTTEVFADNLPGFPDNLSSNGRDTYWLALFAPRNQLLDSLSDYPRLRKMAFRLPEFLQPQPAPHAFVLGFSLEGQVTHNLQQIGRDSYHPITGVREADGKLYLGSLTQDAIAIFQLPTKSHQEPQP